MNENEFLAGSTEELSDVQRTATGGKPVPVWPILRAVSGLYSRHSYIQPIVPSSRPSIPPGQTPLPGFGEEMAEEGISETGATPPFVPFWYYKEELRLDVDGRYPQMTASGTVYKRFQTMLHWIANLKPNGVRSWQGMIWYKDGDVGSFPYTDVQITVAPALQLPQQQGKATVVFSGGASKGLTRVFTFASQYFHAMEFEFDYAENTAPVVSIDTCAHPNRPAGLPCEKLTIEQVFRRAGFDVKKSPGGTVPLGLAGANQTWSDLEMHDAMQAYWAHFAAKAQWSMWVLFAKLHESGTGLGGIMFDDIGPNHRQGTAIFNDSFISQPPQNDPSGGAWVQRMRFWTACHEMGHCFNLAHSWQKSLGSPWIPLADEPNALSFMNYPYYFTGGSTAFFGAFEYRFSNPELLFMRHAPERFVQQGNVNWFDHHGFEQTNVSPEPKFRLQLRVNRGSPVFEFMEPKVMELKLTNASDQPQLVERNLLAKSDHMTIILGKHGKQAKQFIPYAQYCWKSEVMAIQPGASMYESLFISAGQNGWDLAEPGYYTIQVALHLDGEDILSNPLQIRVAPPRSYDEEYIAQDFFTEEVGRILAFDGSRFLTKGNDTLQEVVERFSEKPVAIHAQVALANAMSVDHKQLDLGAGMDTTKSASAVVRHVSISSAKEEEARRRFNSALIDPENEAARSLGHIDYRYYTERFADWLSMRGAQDEAVAVQETLYRSLKSRNVLDRVLEKISDRIKELKPPARMTR